MRCISIEVHLLDKVSNEQVMNITITRCCNGLVRFSAWTYLLAYLLTYFSLYLQRI